MESREKRYIAQYSKDDVCIMEDGIPMEEINQFLRESYIGYSRKLHVALCVVQYLNYLNTFSKTYLDATYSLAQRYYAHLVAIRLKEGTIRQYIWDISKMYDYLLVFGFIADDSLYESDLHTRLPSLLQDKRKKIIQTNYENELITMIDNAEFGLVKREPIIMEESHEYR